MLSRWGRIAFLAIIGNLGTSGSLRTLEVAGASTTAGANCPSLAIKIASLNRIVKMSVVFAVSCYDRSTFAITGVFKPFKDAWEPSLSMLFSLLWFCIALAFSKRSTASPFSLLSILPISSS